MFLEKKYFVQKFIFLLIHIKTSKSFQSLPFIHLYNEKSSLFPLRLCNEPLFSVDYQPNWIKFWIWKLEFFYFEVWWPVWQFQFIPYGISEIRRKIFEIWSVYLCILPHNLEAIASKAIKIIILKGSFDTFKTFLCLTRKDLKPHGQWGTFSFIVRIQKDKPSN